MHPVDLGPGSHDDAAVVRDLRAALEREVRRRQRAERLLHENEELFASTFADAPIGMAVTDLQGRPIRVNHAMCEMVGDTEEAVLADGWVLPVHPDDQEASRAALASLVSGEVSRYQAERRYVHPSGRIVWVQVNGALVRCDGTAPRHAVFLVQDITDRKLGELAVRHGEAMLQSFMAQSPAATFVKDAEGRYVYLNDVGLTVMGGRTLEQVLGRTDEELFPGDTGQELRRDDVAVLQHGRSCELPYEIPSADGFHRWLAHKFVLEDARGNRFLAGTAIDLTERLRIEDALRRSEERFSLAVAGANDVIWDWDLRRNEFYLSPRLGSLLGYERGALDLSVQGWADLVHADDRAALIDALVAHVNHGAPHFEAEYRVRAADGTYRWMRSRGLAMFDASGAPYRIAGSLSDVDARRRAEDQLRESEERFRAMIANCSDLIILGGRGGRMRYLNPAIERILGYTPSELEGLDFRTMIHPDDLEATRQATVHMPPGETTRVEYRFRHKDGSWRWLESSISNKLDDPRLAAFIVNTRDATERHLAEDTLLASERRFALAAAAADEGLWDWNRETNSVYLSDRAIEILGIPATTDANTVRVAWRARMHPDDRERVLAGFHEAEQAGQTRHHSEYRIRGPQGEWRWVGFHGVLVRNVGGRVVRIVGAVADVTARKQAEEAARQHQADLAHVYRVHTAGEMAAGLAHEINQPLAAIVNYARGCLRYLEAAPGGRPVPDFRAVLESIAAEGLRAGEVVRRLRRFVRKEPARREPLVLSEVIAEAVQLIANDAAGARVAVHSEVDPTCPATVGDFVQIEQVLLNLLRNALEAMAPQGGGTLTVRVTHAGGQLEVGVTDTGPGVGAATLGHLLDPFYSTKNGGLGLGLSISRSIIEAHGGQLWAVPNPTRGLTFWFTLPVRSVERDGAG